MDKQKLFHLGNVVVDIRNQIENLAYTGSLKTITSDILELINNTRIATYTGNKDLCGTVLPEGNIKTGYAIFDSNEDRISVPFSKWNELAELIEHLKCERDLYKKKNCFLKKLLANVGTANAVDFEKEDLEDDEFKTTARIQELNSKINEKDQFISKLQNTIDFLNTKLRDINLFVPCDNEQNESKKLEYERDLYKKKYVKCSNLLNSGRLIFTADFSKADLEQFNNDLAETK